MHDLGGERASALSAQAGHPIAAEIDNPGVYEALGYAKMKCCLGRRPALDEDSLNGLTALCWGDRAGTMHVPPTRGAIENSQRSSGDVDDDPPASLPGEDLWSKPGQGGKRHRLGHSVEL